MTRLFHLMFALLSIIATTAQPIAAAGNMRSDDRYEPQHIVNLPPEIRTRVLKLCPDARALHEFASYSDRLRRVTLHFEHLYCGDKAFCKPTGCLHQTYVLSGSKYQLMESQMVPGGR